MTPHARLAAAHSSSADLACVLGHRAAVEAQLEQVPVGLADLPAGSDAQDLHDLVAVEVRPDRGQLLGLGELLDPRLEVVVGAPQPVGLLLVAGGAVGARQHVQPVELVAGVPHVAAYGGVGPLARAVAVEPQVLLDELGHGVGLLAREPQRLHPLAGQLGADDVVVVERDHPVVGEASRARLADVVHQRREAGHEVRAAVAEAALEVDRLLEHGQGVLVDVLVAVVLVALEGQRRQLGQDVRRQAGLHEQAQAPHRVRETPPA